MTFNPVAVDFEFGDDVEASFFADPRPPTDDPPTEPVEPPRLRSPAMTRPFERAHRRRLLGCVVAAVSVSVAICAAAGCRVVLARARGVTPPVRMEKAASTRGAPPVANAPTAVATPPRIAVPVRPGVTGPAGLSPHARR
jgi:hypothetical protein